MTGEKKKKGRREKGEVAPAPVRFAVHSYFSSERWGGSQEREKKEEGGKGKRKKKGEKREKGGGAVIVLPARRPFCSTC